LEALICLLSSNRFSYIVASWADRVIKNLGLSGSRNGPKLAIDSIVILGFFRRRPSDQLRAAADERQQFSTRLLSLGLARTYIPAFALTSMP
jgi:hypothetical protein